MTRKIGSVIGVVLCFIPNLAESQTNRHTSGDHSVKSPARISVTGPQRTMEEGLAAGATAVITLQPVPPKTVPASNYPTGSAIMGQTLTLSAVPARVWLEVHVTGWGPELLRVSQVVVDAQDLDGDGGGYAGTAADCVGVPMVGAGDIAPARQACGGTCSTDGRVCANNSECRLCLGGANGGMVCTSGNNCPGGTCPPLAGITCNGANDACQLNLSGYPIGSSCMSGIPSRCLRWDGVSPGDYFPAGLWCEHGFQDQCDPEWIGTGISETAAVDMSSINFRLGIATDVNEETPDFSPSLLGAFVLDVPVDAKGRYTIDIDQNQTFLFKTYSANDPIPIATLKAAVIEVPCGSCCTNLGPGTSVCTESVSVAECNDLPTTNTHVFRPGATCELCCTSCITNPDCNDGDVCTVDFCDHEVCYCTNPPKPGWEPATECCHPWTGVIASIPQSSPCKIGGCSMGGSHGDPTLTVLPNGSACISNDPCYGDGICQAGICQNEEYAGSGCPKVRFISFAPNTGSTMSAYRVRLVSLHHPSPPYTGAPTADFSAHEGEVRWLGPPNTYDESTSDPTPVYTSFVQCQPHYGDWSGVDLLHVTGGEIIPSSVYEVQSIAQGQDINVESNYSAPLTIRTARWGDIVIPNSPPGTTTQPDAGDIAELVDKFKSTSQPCSKPRALLSSMDVSGIPNLVLDVSFADIAACVGANKGEGYPYAWPASCP